MDQILKNICSFLRAQKTTYLHKVFIFVLPTKNNLSYLHESSVGANRLKQDKLNLLINGEQNGNVAFNFQQTEHKLCLDFFFKFLNFVSMMKCNKHCQIYCTIHNKCWTKIAINIMINPVHRDRGKNRTANVSTFISNNLSLQPG